MVIPNCIIIKGISESYLQRCCFLFFFYLYDHKNYPCFFVFVFCLFVFVNDLTLINLIAVVVSVLLSFLSYQLSSSLISF